jgi:hypothetical protein
MPAKAGDLHAKALIKPEGFAHEKQKSQYRSGCSQQG